MKYPKIKTPTKVYVIGQKLMNGEYEMLTNRTSITTKEAKEAKLELEHSYAGIEFKIFKYVLEE